MQKPRTAMLAMACAVAVVSAMTYVSAQKQPRRRRAPNRSVTWSISRHRATTAPITSRASSCSTPTRATVSSNASRTGCRRPDAGPKNVGHRGQRAAADALCDRPTAG